MTVQKSTEFIGDTSQWTHVETVKIQKSIVCCSSCSRGLCMFAGFVQHQYLGHERVKHEYVEHEYVGTNCGDR